MAQALSRLSNPENRSIYWSMESGPLDPALNNFILEEQGRT